MASSGVGHLYPSNVSVLCKSMRSAYSATSDVLSYNNLHTMAGH